VRIDADYAQSMTMRAARLFFVLIIAACPFARTAAAEPATPIPVAIVSTPDGGHALTRGGEPYFVLGGGGWTNLDALKALGGNSIRTWGTDDLGPILDKAHALGLSVTVGLWLGHERHGFDYNDPKQVADQFDKCKADVLKYKDHPAVLAWGIGNEMEGFDPKKTGNAAIWSAINNIASMVKKIDPDHPTMTVVAEIFGDKVTHIHRLCPDIDLVGINSYGSGASVPERYRALGGTKPYLLTEFGPRGHWESPKTPWGVAFEPTSTMKAQEYRKAYLGAVSGPKAKGLCLGSYVFKWGYKEEHTATWFGLLLEDGNRVAAADVMSELWTATPPTDRCPTIEPIALEGDAERPAGQALRASVKATDPEGKPLTFEWTLMGEPIVHVEGGDAIPRLSRHPDAVRVIESKDGVSIVEVRLPDAKQGESEKGTNAGNFRLCVTVRDGSNGAATANVPLRRKGQ
jgi:hypothetical protein